MRPEAVQIWIQTTGAWFKLHQCLSSLYPVRKDVRVVITDCGDGAYTARLKKVCLDHNVKFFMMPWQTIIEGVIHLLRDASSEEIILLIHDDVIFPPQPTLYIEQITEPLRNHKDIVMCYGKIWDAYYHNINAHGAPPEFPGRELYPENPSFQAVTVSAGFALKPHIYKFANTKADYDFCKILSLGAWEQGLATLYYPTTDVLWHQKAGTVDHYYALPLVARYIMSITKPTDKGNMYHQKWYEAYGETWAESVQRLGGLAEKFAADNPSILKELKC